ncbi:MAG TPA: hypothetical protein VLU38_04425 [Methanomassiliicoccales archaeon]|nr:hypothetical protein [Methanomassiliicoccales archaeon]
MDYSKFEIDLNAKCTCGCMEGKRIHKIYRFPNEVGASVVATPKSEGFREGGFRILVIHFECPPPDNTYCVDDEVMECEDWAVVEENLGQLFSRPRSGH